MRRSSLQNNTEKLLRVKAKIGMASVRSWFASLAHALDNVEQATDPQPGVTASFIVSPRWKPTAGTDFVTAEKASPRAHDDVSSNRKPDDACDGLILPNPKQSFDRTAQDIEEMMLRGLFSPSIIEETMVSCTHQPTFHATIGDTSSWRERLGSKTRLAGLHGKGRAQTSRLPAVITLRLDLGVRMCVCVCLFRCECGCGCGYVCVCIGMCLCVCVCVCVCVHVCVREKVFVCVWCVFARLRSCVVVTIGATAGTMRMCASDCAHARFEVQCLRADYTVIGAHNSPERTHFCGILYKDLAHASGLPGFYSYLTHDTVQPTIERGRGRENNML